MVNETQEQVEREGAELAEKFYRSLCISKDSYRHGGIYGSYPQREGMKNLLTGKVLSQARLFEETIREVYDGDIITASGKAVADWSTRIRLQDAKWVCSSAAMGAASWGITPSARITGSEGMYETAEDYIKKDLRGNYHDTLDIMMGQERISRLWNDANLLEKLSPLFWMREAHQIYNWNKMDIHNEEMFNFAKKRLRQHYTKLRKKD